MPPKTGAKSGKGKDAKGKTGKKKKKDDPEAEAKAAAEAEAKALAEAEEARFQEEAQRLAEAQAAALEEKLSEFSEALHFEALHFAKDELAKESEARRVAKAQENLSAAGKEPVLGTVRAVVDGVVGEVRAYEPKEGRYIVEMPSGALATVKPSALVRYRNPPPPPVDNSVRSAYSSLKTW